MSDLSLGLYEHPFLAQDFAVASPSQLSGLTPAYLNPTLY